MTVELSDVEALAFRLLAESKAWDLRKGSATIHFNQEGVPTAVEIRSFTFSKVINTPDFDHEVKVVV